MNRQSYRTSFFHAYDQERVRRKNPGSVFKPLTWKPRWRMQVALFGLCVGFPWLIAFNHKRIPFHDKIVERMVTKLWHFEDKDNFDTFEKLPPVKTMYDRELKEMNLDDMDIDNVQKAPHLSPQDFSDPIQGGLPIISSQNQRLGRV